MVGSLAETFAAVALLGSEEVGSQSRRLRLREIPLDASRKKINYSRLKGAPVNIHNSQVVFLYHFSQFFSEVVYSHKAKMSDHIIFGGSYLSS